MCLLGLLFPGGPPCLPFQNGWTQIAGWSHSITTWFCAGSVGMAASTVIWRPTTSIHNWQGARSTCRVEAQDAQFVVWHADQVIKKLPIKGLVRQEMAIDEYLKYIRAEALAYERRSSTRSGGEGLASTLTLVAGRVSASASSLLIRCAEVQAAGASLSSQEASKPTSRHPDRL